VLHVEVTAAVRLIANTTRDCHPFGLEFRMERVRVIDPNVSVPGASFRLYGVVGTHDAGLFELGQHDDDAAALDHAETRWLTPKALVAKTELVPVIVGGGHHVIHDEVGRDVPAR